jgi:hypothetical protein
VRLGSIRLWCVAFLGFLLMIGGWSLAAPYDGSPDEIDHVVRAVGVVSGELTPPAADAKRGTGAFQTVPSGLVRQNCWAFDPSRSASCAEPPNSDRTPVVAPSGAGRYFPAYYALVGWPLAWWPGWGGLLAARLIGAALSAAFLAGSVVTIVRRSRHRLMAVGLLVGLTPMATYIAAAINPNGPEIAAAIAFFTGAIHLLLGRADGLRPGGVDRGLMWLVGTSALALAVLRTSSPLWLAVAAVAFLLPWSGPHIRALTARRATWVWVAAVALAGAAAVTWIVARDAADLGDYSGDTVLTASQAWMIEVENWRGYLDQAVGVTGWLDTRMSSAFYFTWQGAAIALLACALVVGRWLDRWRLFVLMIGGLFVPALLEVTFANETGFITQGRYLLPMLAGVALFAAFVLEERGIDGDRARSTIRFAVVLLLPIHLVCMLYTMARWQRGLPDLGERGITSLDPTQGDWQPVVGSVTPLVVESIGLLIIGALFWTAAAGAAPRASARAGVLAPEPSEVASDHRREDSDHEERGDQLGRNGRHDRVAGSENQREEERGACGPGESRSAVRAQRDQR